MGLRERKAARAREHMADIALDLFLVNGYDETTMEQIAERAEVGASTLYRYFPSKDLLVLDRLAEAFRPGTYVRAHPTDEPLEEVIAGALLDMTAVSDDPRNRMTQIRRLVDSVPPLRARVWIGYADAQSDLENALAERMNLPASSLSVKLTAGIVTSVLQIVDEERKRSDDPLPAADIMKAVLEDLPSASLVLPALPGRTQV